MRQTFFKKMIMLSTLTALLFFSTGIGLIKAQTAPAQPNFTIHLYAVDATTKQAITLATKKIMLGAIVLADNNSYGFIKVQGSSYTIYNRTGSGVWAPATDQASSIGDWLLVQAPANGISPSTSFSGLLSIYDPIFGNSPYVLTLKNTSANNGLYVTVNLTVSYNAVGSNVVQSYNTTVSDQVYSAI